MNTLKQATENLYQVFSKYGLKGGLRDRSCPCCVSEGEIRELVKRPMSDLSVEEIGHFARSAISTFGDIDDFKHFLPRILELFQDRTYDLIDDFLTFEKLNYAEWETWDEHEIEVIENYFLALWSKSVSDENCPDSFIENAFHLVSKYNGIEKALKIWENRCSKKSVGLIVEYILKNPHSRLRESDYYTFWNWASSETNLNRLEELYFEIEDELEASRISVAYTLLEKN